MPRGVYIRTEEAIRNVSLANKGKNKGKPSPMKGKHHSEESKQKMKLAKLGKHYINISLAKKGDKHPNFGKHHSEETKRKLSLAHKGVPLSEEHKKNLSFAHIGLPIWNKGKKWGKELRDKLSGVNSIHWRGGLSFEPYGVEFNKKLRKEIRIRDNYTCQKCNITEKYTRCALSVHHIDYNKKNNKKSNLISLCKGCNSKVNFNRQYWTNYFKNKLLLPK